MTEHDLIRQIVLDYFEGWFDGDPVRMERALHKDLVKRRAGDDLGVTTKQRMVELTARGEGKSDNGDGRIEMKITDVSDDIASVSVRAVPYHEYIHLVRTGDGWKVANTLWRLA